MTTAAPANPVKAFLRLVMIEHSVFALPFAFLAALTAMRLHTYCGLSGYGWGDQDRGWFSFSSAAPTVRDGTGDCSVGDWLDLPRLLLLTLAMVAARTFAMAANRLIDREVDARNPRTAQRELVTGAVSLTTARIGAGVALLVFLVVAGALGPLPLLLAPLAVLPLVVYPYAKRFTDYPHAVLALAQAVAPVGAWLAVTGDWSWSAVVLGLGVGLWIGGFDLVYACQDTDSDRAQGVRSVPARWGNAVALRAARLVHVVVFALFAGFGAREGFGPVWYGGLLLTGAAFVYQHAIVSPQDLSRVNRSFFTSNGFVGLALGAAGVLDLVAR
ncbi:MAG TPA: 4-hydroxybenzoate octaprenyltransferase [Mycobacteriales bacterium]|nr:4-hydroxybenzoate octaprenyltransferase [Mycobacteriales bacterium]